MVYIHTHWRFLQSWRIRFIPDVAIGLFCLFPSVLFAQEIILEVNSFKTALPDNVAGDWDDPATWEVWDGTTWTPTMTIPARTNDVFIEQAQEVRLNANQEVRNLYLYSAANTSKKLNLQNFNLDVYGALRCFQDHGHTRFGKRDFSGDRLDLSGDREHRIQRIHKDHRQQGLLECKQYSQPVWRGVQSGP